MHAWQLPIRRQIDLTSPIPRGSFPHVTYLVKVRKYSKEASLWSGHTLKATNNYPESQANLSRSFHGLACTANAASWMGYN